jgi:hypothetical protein
MPERTVELAAKQSRTGELVTPTFNLTGRESVFEIDLDMDVAVMKTSGAAYDIEVERSEDGGFTWLHVAGSQGWEGSDNVDRTDRHGRINTTPVFRSAGLDKWSGNLFRVVINFKAATAMRIAVRIS